MRCDVSFISRILCATVGVGRVKVLVPVPVPVPDMGVRLDVCMANLGR